MYVCMYVCVYVCIERKREGGGGGGRGRSRSHDTEMFFFLPMSSLPNFRGPPPSSGMTRLSILPSLRKEEAPENLEIKILIGKKINFCIYRMISINI